MAALALSGTKSCGTPPIAGHRKRADMSVNPIGERLSPARSGKCEARRAQNCTEDLRHAQFVGVPVDDDWKAVAGNVRSLNSDLHS